MFYLIKLSIHRDPKINWSITFKLQTFAHFSLDSLTLHPRSRRGAERIRQGKGRASETALERSDLTEKFRFSESHTKAETKKLLTKSLPPQKQKSFYMYVYRVCMSLAPRTCKTVPRSREGAPSHCPLSHLSCRRRHIVRVMGWDTQCLLQV